LISVAGEYQRRYVIDSTFVVSPLRDLVWAASANRSAPVLSANRRKAAASGLSISSGLSVSSASAMGSVPSGRWSPLHSPPTPRERVNELEDHVARDDGHDGTHRIAHDVDRFERRVIHQRLNIANHCVVRVRAGVVRLRRLPVAARVRGEHASTGLDEAVHDAGGHQFDE